MLAKIVICFIFVVVDRSLTVDAKGICPNGQCCGCHNKNPIAFYSALTKHTTLSGSETIVYNKIYTNLGQAYDSSNGKFRAPVNGLYYFACTQISVSGNVHFILMKNSSKLGHGYSVERGETGSVIGAVLLEEGDVVTVQHHADAGSQQLHGADYSTFTGYLITPLSLDNMR